MSMSRAWVCLFLIAAVFSSLSYAATPDRIPGPIASGSKASLRGNVQHKALPQYDQGRVDPALQFGSITLHSTPTPAQQKALTQLLADQQDRNSPNYHKWLTPEQWADRFGLSQNDIQRITTWLSSEGFTVRNVARGRNWVTFSGTAAQVEKTFGTEIHHFNVNGELHVANASSPKIPAALSGIVTLIRGLDDFHLRPRVKVRPGYYDANFQSNFVAPGDIATIYDINPLYNATPTHIDGTGQKLGIIGQTDIYLSDLNDFRTGFGLTAITTTSCTTNTKGVVKTCADPHLAYVVPTGLTDPGVPLTTGDLSEADVDIEIAGAVARNAQIVYVNAPATFDSQGGIVSGGVWQAWYYAVDQGPTVVAPVLSMSYGNCEFNDNGIIDPSTGLDGPDETELKKANSEGITFVNSTGDSGAAECDPGGSDTNGSSATQGIAVGYPASSPEVTGVGGTATPLADFSPTYWNTVNNAGGDGGSAITYVPEQTWNDDEELAQFCSQNSTNTFCTQGGSTAVTGWKAVTSAQIMQEDLAINGSGISSGGGGASNCATQNAGFSTCVSGFPQPVWQSVTISGQPSARFSPDVSFLASPNFPGYIFCTELSELGQTGTGSSCAGGIQTSIDTYNALIGGTSVSSPLFAGIVTLMNQSLAATGGSGNVNPVLYELAQTPANGAFHPVTASDNNVYCTASTPSGQPQPLVCPVSGVMGFSASNTDATTSYNLATGLGSIDVNNLAVAWKAMAPAPGFTLSASTASLTATVGAASNSTTITANPVNGFAGTVTFACSRGLPTAATCQFTSTGATSATLAIQTASSTGNTQNAAVVITGTSGAVSSSAVVALTVTGGPQSFTLQSNLGGSGTLAVTQGSTGTVNLGVYSTNGFVTTSGGNSQTALAVTYTCSGLPTAASCTFSPGSPTQAPLVTLTVSTQAPTAKLDRPFGRGTRIFYATLLPGLFGLILTLGSRRRSLKAMRVLGLIVVLGLSATWLASCGGNSSSTGGGGNPGTPKGSYPIKVNATTSNSAISSNTSFTLQVN